MLAEGDKLDRYVIEALIGLGPLEALLADPTVSDVLVNAPDDVWVERNGELLADQPEEFRLAADDALYICGTTQAVNRYYEEYPASHL